MKKIAFVVIAGVVLIASCSKKTVPVASKIDASGVYQTNCSKCHGVTGVEGRAPNLSQIGDTKAEILNIVTHGKGHMPPFSDKLSTKEIEAVADFVLALKK